jgi:hypothetical protein
MVDLTQSVILLVQQHRGWAVVIVFLLAFCESFAFVSLLVPGRRQKDQRREIVIGCRHAAFHCNLPRQSKRVSYFGGVS